MNTFRITALSVAIAACAVANAPAQTLDESRWPAAHVDQPTPAMADMPAELARNLANFDDLDFRVFSGQQWQDLHKSHTADIKVHWPDGHVTEGIDRHIQDLSYMWTYAPDTRIEEHPIRFGTADSEWTAVMGWMEGTFTQPMVTADGKVIAPTGKAYRIPMATLGHWNKDGIMFEEYLFWDNATYLQQLGIGN